MAETNRVFLNIPRDTRILQNYAQASYDLAMDSYTEEFKDRTEIIAYNETPKVFDFLVDSLHAEVVRSPGRFSIAVHWDAFYANFVDAGTGPHWVPIGPLLAWAGAKFGDTKIAYMIRSSIASHGTQPNSYVQRTRDKINKELRPFFATKINGIAAFLRGD